MQSNIHISFVSHCSIKTFVFCFNHTRPIRSTRRQRLAAATEDNKLSRRDQIEKMRERKVKLVLVLFCFGLWNKRSSCAMRRARLTYIVHCYASGSIFNRTANQLTTLNDKKSFSLSRAVCSQRCGKLPAKFRRLKPQQ